jgi:hypothetical protein
VLTRLIEFTEEQFEPTRGQNAGNRVVDALRERPGTWAAVEHYPLARVQSARSRGCNAMKRHPGVQYHVKVTETEAILYMRFTEG